MDGPLAAFRVEAGQRRCLEYSWHDRRNISREASCVNAEKFNKCPVLYQPAGVGHGLAYCSPAPVAWWAGAAASGFGRLLQCRMVLASMPNSPKFCQR